MLEHSNVNCSIQMFILCNKMMYFGDFVILVPYISSEFMLSSSRNEYLMVLYKNYVICMHAASINTNSDKSKQKCIIENVL